MGHSPIRVLLVEDQEVDYLLTRRMLSACENQPFDLQWASSWQAGIDAIRRCAHDVCLLDFRIAGGDGLELLKESRDIGCRAPVIFLTGISDYRLDVEAMELGAADFLIKDKLTAELLERSIRYAIKEAATTSELLRRQEALRASEMRFRSVVQSAGDAIILSDENGKILFWNKSAETIFGYAEDEVLGASIEVLMPEPFRTSYRAGLERFRVTGRSGMVGSVVELQGLRKDGTLFPLELSLAAWTNGNGIMFTAIIRDISERKRVARMSHELRTPLEAIIGATDLLLTNKEHNLTDQNIDSLERIRINAKDQLQLIRGVLDTERQSPSI